jgi:hypothetical protein
MEESIQARSQAQVWYARLDTFLLYLLTVELSYFILLMLAGVVVGMLAFVTHSLPLLNSIRINSMWAVLPYFLAFIFNMLGGLFSGILNIRTKHQGYPGTGHLVNWIFLMTMGWLFMLLLMFSISAGRGFGD